MSQDLARARPGTPLPLSPALRTQQAHRLARRIGAHLTGQLTVAITDNRAVMISVQRDPQHRRYHARLHHLFVDAPDAVVDALARYIRTNDRTASKELNAFIDENQDRIRPTEEPAASPRATELRAAGRVHDLAVHFDELNRTYFAARPVRARITWGRQVGLGRSRRSIKVGSYSFEEDLIRIHPGLDQEWIPGYYLRWVIYHEMLHATQQAPLVNGRHAFHTPEFAAEERRFVGYAEATDWERRNIAALLCI
jgi:hypothetical protein